MVPEMIALIGAAGAALTAFALAMAWRAEREAREHGCGRRAVR